MHEEKDNTRKVITFMLVGLGGGLMSYLAVMVPEVRTEAVLAISNWTGMVLVWYFAAKPRS
jgi:hypothetical protein